MSRPTDREVESSWREGYAPFIAATRERFAFLEESGYRAPEVFVTAPECTIVYKGGGATIAVRTEYVDAPWVQVVPVEAPNRSFGLNEAMRLLAPAEEPAREKPPFSEALWRAWMEFHAAFLESHLDEITKPSPELLDRIEARR